MKVIIKYATDDNGNNLYGLGNNLFRYCLGRILAEENNRTLTCDDIKGFPAATGDNKESPESLSQRLDGMILPPLDQSKDWLIDKHGLFQRYEYYKEHKDNIREWLNNPDMILPCHNDDLVLHYRMTDYRGQESIMNPAWCAEVIRGERFDRLYIVTDEPNGIPKQLLSFDPIVVSGSCVNDFYFIKSFKQIFLSESTFSWWAAWLSDATRIIWPKTKYGMWSGKKSDRENPNFNKIDLWVHDEPRYIMVHE